MAADWTPERRAHQARAVRLWKPWEQSTGPRSVEGKARVSLNAYRGGQRQKMRELTKAINELLGTQRDRLGRVGVDVSRC